MRAPFMDVLFINPNREHMPWPVMPIGLCTVASACSRAGHRVEVCDLAFSSDPGADTEAALRRFPARVVALGIRNLDNCNFEAPHFYLEEIRDEVVAAVRRSLPAAELIVGGAGVNVAPRSTMAYLGADHALVGEGEEAMVAILDALDRGEAIGGLAGVLSRDDPGKLALLGAEPGAGRARLARLGAPFHAQAWRWLDMGAYGARGTPYPIQTKRGCALSCSYCVYNTIEGRHYRLRRPVDVVDEIEEACEHGVRSFDFVDSTFNLPVDHARAVCDELAARDLPVMLSTMGLNPAGCTPELVADLRRARFESVMCTPESASEITLRSLGKGFGVEQIERAAYLLREADIPTYWFFLLGAPGETTDTLAETLAFCERHIPSHHMVLFATGIRVYPGTPLERHCRETGWFGPEDDLLLPSWYLSPGLDLEAAYRMLVEGASRHPNWMVNAETILERRTAARIKTLFRWLGLRGAFWRYLPSLFRLRNWAGERPKQLGQIARRLSEVRDVAHHR